MRFIVLHCCAPQDPKDKIVSRLDRKENQDNLGQVVLQASVCDVRKPQMDIPIPISYIFHAHLCIKKFQLRTQLMSLISFSFLLLSRASFLGFSCYLIKRGVRVPRTVSQNQASARCFQFDLVPDFGCILEFELINCIFNWNIRCV